VEQQVVQLEELIRQRDRRRILGFFREPENHAGIDDVLRSLDAVAVRELAQILGDEEFADVVGGLDAYEGAAVLLQLSVADAADVLEAMDPDDAADVMGEIEAEEATRLLIEMQPVEAEELRALLAYPPDTAGGRMTPAFVSIDPDLRADQAVVALRRLSQEAETINYVYVTDPQGRLVGVLSLRRLVLGPPETPVREAMETDVITVGVDTDQEVAARLLTEFDLFALPVLDDNQRLVGIITADDVADILEREATEDFHRFGGVEPLPQNVHDVTFGSLFRSRIRWLVILVFVNIFSGAAIATFEETIEAVVALVFFLPLLIDSGGNAGSQSATLMVRALATGEVRLSQWWNMLAKQLTVALALGLAMGVAVSWLGIWRGGFDVGLVVAVTMVIVVIVGSLIGTVLPFILTRFGVDPAIASGPLITSLADISGVIIYFSIATWYLL
jgi:magnesium transporter